MCVSVFLVCLICFSPPVYGVISPFVMMLGAAEVTPLPLMIWTPSLQRKEVSPAAWRLGGGGGRELLILPISNPGDMVEVPQTAYYSGGFHQAFNSGHGPADS